MKKTMISLAVASLIATTAMAADKGIDIVTTGQAVLYYETHQDDATGSKDMFDSTTSDASVGLQLNLDADLKNNFTFGSQLSYIGTAGLDENIAAKSKQGVTNGGTDSTTDEIALTQIFVAKKIANTTVKIGRQELPKSLSPFAYSEGWNVFKNTFDAILAVNTDIPDTTLVGAYISGGTSMSLGTTDNLTIAGGEISGATYMATVQNKSIPMTTVTASYYDIAQIDQNATTNASSEGARIVWFDATIAGKDLPMGLNVGLQGGSIMPEITGADDTTAFGAKIGIAPVSALTLGLAYTTVDDGAVGIKNLGTGIKSPLYTQMVYNQNAIARDADTFVAKAAYNTGEYGTVTAQYGHTAAGDKNNMMLKDYGEFDLIYSVKAAGVQYFAAYIYRNIDNGGSMGAVAGGAETDNRVRFWGRYNF